MAAAADAIKRREILTRNSLLNQDVRPFTRGRADLSFIQSAVVNIVAINIIVTAYDKYSVKQMRIIEALLALRSDNNKWDSMMY